MKAELLKQQWAILHRAKYIQIEKNINLTNCTRLKGSLKNEIYLDGLSVISNIPSIDLALTHFAWNDIYLYFIGLFYIIIYVLSFLCIWLVKNIVRTILNLLLMLKSQYRYCKNKKEEIHKFQTKRYWYCYTTITKFYTFSINSFLIGNLLILKFFQEKLNSIAKFFMIISFVRADRFGGNQGVDWKPRSSFDQEPAL